MPTPIVKFDFERNTRSAKGQTLIDYSDGDTIVIRQALRLVSCDTPEKEGFAGKPPTAQQKLNVCRERLGNGFYNNLPENLRAYLLGKLTGDAAERHINAGNQASKVFKDIVKERITRPDGTTRKVAVIPTGEIIDSYGRMLCYTAPFYTKSELPPKNDPSRLTFNHNMVANGWAAFFAVYPSLPQNDDMNLMIAAAESAWDEQKGAWNDFGDILLGYEFRACVKLAQAETGEIGAAMAFQRICVDLRNLQEVGKYGFWNVPPCYRLWIWEDDIERARVDLDLKS